MSIENLIVDEKASRRALRRMELILTLEDRIGIAGGLDGLSDAELEGMYARLIKGENSTAKPT